MRRFIPHRPCEAFRARSPGLALAGFCLNTLSLLPERAARAFPLDATATRGIGLDDILRSYVGLLATGESDFEAVAPRRMDEAFKSDLGITRVPSPETLRQRLDENALALRALADACSLDFLKSSGVLISPVDSGHIPLDCDTFLMDNSNSRKEGVSPIGEDREGYAPVAARLGAEGWCLELDLREGRSRRSSPEATIPFLDRAIERARRLGARKVLLRLDAGGDCLETRAGLAGRARISHIIRWNTLGENRLAWAGRIFGKGDVSRPRPGKRVGVLAVRVPQAYRGRTYRFKRVMRAIETTIDDQGQRLTFPRIELDGWWTSLSLPKERVIRLYEERDTPGTRIDDTPFHIHVNRDMKLERPPSGKFATNALILALAGLTYNIMRAMGRYSGREGP